MSRKKKNDSSSRKKIFSGNNTRGSAAVTTALLGLMAAENAFGAKKNVAADALPQADAKEAEQIAEAEGEGAEATTEEQTAAGNEADAEIAAEDESVLEQELAGEFLPDDAPVMLADASQLMADEASAAKGGMRGGGTTAGDELASNQGAAAFDNASAGTATDAASASAPQFGADDPVAPAGMDGGAWAGLGLLAALGGGGGGGGGFTAPTGGGGSLPIGGGGTNPLPSNPLPSNQPQVLTIEQAAAGAISGPFKIVDTAANLYGKYVQSHGPALMASAIAVVVTDSPTLMQALGLINLPNANFLASSIATNGAAVVDFSDIGKLHAAGLCFDHGDVVTAMLEQDEMGSAVADAAQLHAAGIDYLDVIGNEISISEQDAAALIQYGIGFASSDNVVMQAEGTVLQTSFQSLQLLGVDSVQTSAAHHGLQLSFGEGALTDDPVPHFDAGLDVTLGIGMEQIGDIAAHADALRLSGIDFLDAGTAPVSITDAEACALVDSGLAFTADSALTMQAAGTHLQTTFENLQDLGVDTVISTHGPKLEVDLGDGSAPQPGSLPSFDTALDVTLELDTNQVDALLDHAADLSATNIDRLSVESTLPADLSSRSGEELLAALNEAGIDELHISSDATVTLSDLQAQALLDAGMLTSDDSADVTVEDRLSADELVVGELDVSLADLALLGADHVDTIGRSELLVNVGIALTDDTVNAELEALLNHFAQGEPLFATDEEVTLALGDVDLGVVEEAITAELKLLGIDNITSVDSLGITTVQPLT